MLLNQSSVITKDRLKSSRRLVKEPTTSRLKVHKKGDKGQSDVAITAMDVAGHALSRALDMTVTGEFKKKQDVKQLSRATAEDLVSRMLELTPLSLESSESQLGDEEGKVRFAYLEDAEDEEDLSQEEEEEEVEGEDREKQEGEKGEDQYQLGEHGEEDQDEESTRTRRRSSAGLLQRVEELRDEELVLRITNLLLQRKIGQINAARKDTSALPDAVRKLRLFKRRSSVDPHQRYRDALIQYRGLKETLAKDERRFSEDLTRRRSYRRSLERQLQSERCALLGGLERLALRSTGLGLGTGMGELLAQVTRRLAALRAEHGRFVHTQRVLKDVQARMRTLEMFGERKQLADFEQLVEDNQKLKERVEERDDMIGILKARAVRELQEAAHMRDMMHGTEEDIETQVRKLAIVDDRLEWSRDAVAKAKRRRDYIRRRTKKVMEELDLLAYPHLLQHFQELRRATEDAQATLSELVQSHLDQEADILRVRSRLLRLSRIFNEKLPEQVLEALNQRASISRIAESCVQKRGDSGDVSEVVLQRRSIVSLDEGERQ